jgi:hypothetical protein
MVITNPQQIGLVEIIPQLPKRVVLALATGIVFVCLFAKFLKINFYFIYVHLLCLGEC